MERAIRLLFLLDLGPVYIGERIHWVEHWARLASAFDGRVVTWEASKR